MPIVPRRPLRAVSFWADLLSVRGRQKEKAPPVRVDAFRSQRWRQPAIIAILCLLPTSALAQDQSQAAPPAKPDTRTQLPELLQDSYLGLNIGYLSNPFSARQLQPGFTVGSVSVPHAAYGIGLFGYRLNRHLAAQITYVRPVNYVRYRDINGAATSNSVWMAYGAFTLKTQVPLTPATSVYAEAGLGITNRRGFDIGGAQVVAHELFRTFVVGGGLEYRASKSWDVVAGALYFPSDTRTRQPHALFVSGGVRYNAQVVPAHRVAANANSGFRFPEHHLTIAYSTHAMGYGANRVLSRQVPIFWGGKINVRSGGAVHYQRNVFHTSKIFALDFGMSVSRFESAKNRESFMTVSLYPQLRFVLLRSTNADMYVSYSVAGPTFISRKVIDGRETGRHRFTFQDGLGLGFYLGRDKRALFGIKLGHYSNGNLVGLNPGIAVPLAFELGYTF